MTAVLATLAVSVAGTRLLASTVETLMNGTIDRAKSILSGRIEYRFESGVVGPNAPPPNRAPAKLVSFEDSEWIESNLDGTTRSLHRKNYALQYDEVRQPEGRIERTAVLSKPARAKDREGENRHPWFAGTFWRRRQLEYVLQHRDEFRPGKASEIDGIHCELCELDVPADDVAHVVHIVHPKLAVGAKLRLHISPAMGFVLPLIEVAAPDGTAIVTYESKGFLHFDGNAVFPRLIRMEARLPNGLTWYERYDIKPERINQPLPESEFVIAMPAATQVRDERDPTQVLRFDLSAPSTSAELAGDQLSESDEPKGASLRNWVVLLTVGLVVLLCCYAFVIRYVRSRT